MKRKAPEIEEVNDHTFAHWATDLFPGLRGEVREVLRAQGDFATIASLRMTSKRERDDTKVFFQATGCHVKWPNRTFIDFCFRLKYWPLLEWGLRVYPKTAIAFDSPTSRTWSLGDMGWEMTFDIAVNVALPDGDDDDI